MPESITSMVASDDGADPLTVDEEPVGVLQRYRSLIGQGHGCPRLIGAPAMPDAGCRFQRSDPLPRPPPTVSDARGRSDAWAEVPAQGFGGRLLPVGHRQQLEQLAVGIADEQGHADIALLDDLPAELGWPARLRHCTSSTEIDRWVRPGSFMVRARNGAVAPAAA